MEVSVIVCTRNRAASLERCLASIAADPSIVAAEVVVVDNASSDGTALVAQGASRLSPRPFSVIREEAPGLSRARNLGVRHARGSLLLFTDDDVEVRPGWIAALAAPFDDSRVGAVGGRIVPTFVCARPEWLTGDSAFFPLTLHDLGVAPFCFTGGHLPTGANMAIRANVLPSDPFDVCLGHTGKLALGFDEFELLEKIAADHVVVYAPGAVVCHMLDAGRVTVPRARRTLFQLGFGMGRWQRRRGGAVPTLARSVVRTARAWRDVRRARDLPTELRAWQEFGKQMEWLFGTRVPWLAAWCAERLAGRG